MCVTSMVSQHYWDMYPVPALFPQTEWPNFSELLRKAKLYDEMTKQADCPDPVKAQWVQDLERVMREKYGLHPKA